jgi:hypothetical protein
MLRAFVLLFVFVIDFILFFVYLCVQYPGDDGHCAEQVTQAACGESVTLFDSEEALCRWQARLASGDNQPEAPLEDYFSCQYKDPSFSFHVCHVCHVCHVVMYVIMYVMTCCLYSAFLHNII